LLAIEHILARDMPAAFGRAERAPGDAVARGVQAGERALEAVYLGEHLRFGNLDAVHDDLAGDRRAKTELAVDRRGRQPGHSLLEDEALDPAVVVAADALGPDDEHVGDRRIGDPHLVASEPVAAVDLVRARLHRAGVGTMVG